MELSDAIMQDCDQDGSPVTRQTQFMLESGCLCDANVGHMSCHGATGHTAPGVSQGTGTQTISRHLCISSSSLFLVISSIKYQYH